MNTEIITLQNELALARQQNEILQLKHQLQVTQAKKASKLEDSLFSPELYEHYQKVALMMSKSEIVPNSYRGKPADIFIAMEMGYQLGFPIAQSLQDIAVINGRPCLWGDGLLALVLSHPDCEYINEEPIYNSSEVFGYKCIIKRKGYDVREQIFTLKDATSAGLLKKPGPWTQYPKRMLQMRARAYALRDVFGDALRGFKMAEEQQDIDIIEGDYVETIQSKTTHTEKLKDLLGIKKDEKVRKNTDVESGHDKPYDSGLSDAAGASGGDGSDGPGVTLVGDNNDRRDELRISPEQIEKIQQLFKEKEFTEKRITKALNHYEVNALEELTFDVAASFLIQLEKA